MLKLTRSTLDGLPKTGPTDPIEYYRQPLVGWIFRERINMGLRLLGDRRYARALEVGYGAGAVLLTIAPQVSELVAIDLDANPEPVHKLLASRGLKAELAQGSVCALPYSDASFDLVVSYSVFEHISEYKKALSEVARTLKPGGHFLLGMPSVNRMMEVGFRLIGFKGIEDHHVTTPADVSRAFRDVGLRVVRSRTLDLPARPLRLYYTWLLEKVGAAS
jgi:2-polyprenyl-3-methyl-5-hydroxy-6-metoxy-1,4-benzoquinol methylase